MTVRTKQAGVTLIELMIAIVIVSILAAIAVPSYNQYYRKAERQKGAACLMEASKRAQTYMQRKGVYPTSLVQLGYTAARSDCERDAGDANASYQIEIVTTNVACTSADGGGFGIKAYPMTTRQQQDGFLQVSQCFNGNTLRYRSLGDNTW